MKKFAAFAAAFATCISFCGTANAESIVIGQLDGVGNCFPFGCAGDFGPSTRYQQVYDGAAFSGPLLIRELQFYATQTGPDFLLNTGTFQFHLSTTTKPVDGLDIANFDANVGADDALFAVVPLGGGQAPGVLRIDGSSFFYDPAAGNLLLDVFIPGGARHVARSNAFFEAHGPSDNPDHLFSRAHNFGSGTSGFGLVTGFFDSSTAVPEPASLLLMTTGLVGLRRWKEWTAPR